jgi:3-hydroxybutyrate dehydrogenase
MLNGKAAIVTGSTSGIGLGIARSLAEAGCNVMLNGFGEAKAIESERAGIEKEFGVQAIFDPADLTKPAAVVKMIEAAGREFGTVDILVNNAGIQYQARANWRAHGIPVFGSCRPDQRCGFARRRRLDCAIRPCSF